MFRPAGSGGVWPAAAAIALAALVTLAIWAPVVASGSTRSPWAHRSAPASAVVHAPAPPLLSGWWKLPSSGSAPVNRTEGMMTFDSEDGYDVLFGGCPGYAEFGCGASGLDDTWTFSNGTWTQLHPAHSPPPLSAAVLADDPYDGYLVLYGGDGPNGSSNETWTFSQGDWNEVQTALTPPALERAAMAYDPGSEHLVLVGGEAPGQISGSEQTWTYQNGGWQNVTASVHPPGWISPFFALDPATGHLLLSGGVTAPVFPTYQQQSWTYSAGSWQNVTSTLGPNEPGSRVGGLGGYSAGWNETLLFGGGAGAGVDRDLWTLGGTGEWSQAGGVVEPTGAFYSTQSAYYPATGGFVAFCQAALGSFYGLTTINGIYNSTWLLTTAIQGTVNSSLGAHAGLNSTFQVTASGGVPPYRYAWGFGDNGTTNGSSTAVHAYARAGSYNVTVTVNDSLGQMWTRTWTVNVSAAPSGSSTSGPLTGPLPLVTLLLVAVLVVAIVGLLWMRRRRPPALRRPVGGDRASPGPPGTAGTGPGTGEAPPPN